MVRLNGLRVIAILFVVLGHTYAFMPSSNETYDYDVVKARFSALWMIGSDPPNDGVGFLSVDTFFFLSGFLFMWGQLKSYSLNDKTTETPCGFTGKLFLFRWLRLTPMYFFILMIYIYVFPDLGNGPDWHTGDLVEGSGKSEKDFCKEAWITNVLYISNLYPGQLTEIGHMDAPNGEAELGCCEPQDKTS